jgi:hypothetical protein
MTIVKHYNSAKAFAEGVDKQSDLNWYLLSWQMVSYSQTNDILIVAVFKGRLT